MPDEVVNEVVTTFLGETLRTLRSGNAMLSHGVQVGKDLIHWEVDDFLKYVVGDDDTGDRHCKKEARGRVEDGSGEGRGRELSIKGLWSFVKNLADPTVGFGKSR